MKKTTIALTVLSSILLVGCSSTTVVKDISGPQVVDVMYAKFAQEVTHALNRLADVEDMNKVNVINDYNANLDPLNKSYSGTVAKQNKIVIPDTYPQTQWRNDGVQSTSAPAPASSAPAYSSVKLVHQPAMTESETVQAKPVQQTAMSQPVSQTQSQSIVNQAIANNNGKIYAAASTVPPSRFKCPEGSEVRRNGPTTICVTETKVSQ